jgi:hypothetical protein
MICTMLLSCHTRLWLPWRSMAIQGITVSW